jgi:hypothetical protein
MEDVILERDALYKRVWSEPMWRLGPNYGISDVALAKICKKMDIPRPWPGYWARKAAGYKVPQPPLPPLKQGIQSSVTLTARPPRQEPGQEAAAKIAAEQDEVHLIHVADRLVRAHPLVKQAGQLLRAAKPDEGGLVSGPRDTCLDVRVAKKNLPRALRIVDALLKALNERGHGVELQAGTSAGTYAKVLGERLQIGATADRPGRSAEPDSTCPDEGRGRTDAEVQLGEASEVGLRGLGAIAATDQGVGWRSSSEVMARSGNPPA